MDIFEPVIKETKNKLLKVKSDKKKLQTYENILKKQQNKLKKAGNQFPAVGDEIFLTQVEISKKEQQKEFLQKKLKNNIRRQKVYKNSLAKAERKGKI